MQDFKKLKVWEKGHTLTLEIYKHTMSFPNSELYSLTIQLRKAAYSIPSNIAEGCGRDTDAELARFLRIAMGSANEVEYLVLLSKDLGYLKERNYINLIDIIIQTKKMLNSLIKKLITNG